MRNIFFALLFCTSLLTNPLFSAERNHYPLGFNGINSGIRPERTIVWVQFLNYYKAKHIAGPNGDDLPIHGHFTEDLALQVFHWYSDIPLLGGTYGCSTFLPFVGFNSRFTDNDTGITSFGGSNAFQFSDMHIEPINLAYRYEYLNLYLAYGFYIPTGKFKPGSTSNLGFGCWGNQFTFSGTYFMDKEKTFTASAYATYEIHSKVRGINLYPGDNLCIDWGIGKTFAKIYTVGVAGYAEWQTTKDTGRDVPPGTNGSTDRVYAMGPEIQIDIPQASGQCRFRYEFEYGVRNRTRGRAAIGLLLLVFKY